MLVRQRQEIQEVSRGVSPAGIELHDLAKSYGPIDAVRGIDVSVAPGETVALLGPNGAGKSTTIDMLLGLTRPDRGTVEVFGAPPQVAVSRGAVAAMLQTGALIRDVSVNELITMVASLYPKPLGVDETMELTGIGDIRGQRTQKLSGGQTQRVRFAIALVTNPDLLVLDEPTVAMDVESRHAFWMTMREFASRGKTVFFATHYLEEADDFADRVVLMAAGAVVADGPPTEIKGWPPCRESRMSSGAARRSSLPAPTPMRRCGRCSSASPPRGTSRSAAPASKRRSSS